MSLRLIFLNINLFNNLKNQNLTKFDNYVSKPIKTTNSPQK